MKCIFIYNPQSGRGKIGKKLSYIVKRLHKKYEIVDVYETKAKGDLTEKVRTIANDYDCIIFSGGDGTFNEVLRGFGDREDIPKLGYIPGGTCNDVAHSLGIPRKNLRGAINVILKGRVEKLDCMRVNKEDYAMYSISAGAFTSASYTTPRNLKKSFGMVAYGVEGIRKNFPLPIYHVHITGGSEEIDSENVFTLIMNGKCVAGWKMNPDGSMQDGKLECAVVEQTPRPNALNKLRALLKIARLFLFGYRFKEDLVAHSEGDSFHIEVSDEVVWNYDGEQGRVGSIDVEVLKNHVPIYVPKNNKNI